MRHKTKKKIYNITVGLLIFGALGWVFNHFIHFGNIEYTDNAQIKQLITPVNSRVQGFIKKIYFDDYQFVKKGDTLVIIEDAEFRYHLAQAEADWQNALFGRSAIHATIYTTESNISVSDAAISEAKVLLENAERDHIRYRNLWEQEAVTKQEYEAILTNYEALKARYEQLIRQRESTTWVKNEQKQRLEQSEANIKLAEAAVELAKLNLSYTVILAPCDGTTGRKNLQEGQLIQSGQTMVDLVDANEQWVVANYKEKQLKNITEGNEVDIQIDAIPNVKFKGYVKSVSRATGASFSLIPQDNSSGNFVKVQQRIPVRIEFSSDNSPEKMKLLGSGMNVICKIKYN